MMRRISRPVWHHYHHVIVVVVAAVVTIIVAIAASVECRPLQAWVLPSVPGHRRQSGLGQSQQPQQQQQQHAKRAVALFSTSSSSSSSSNGNNNNNPELPSILSYNNKFYNNHNMNNNHNGNSNNKYEVTPLFNNTTSSPSTSMAMAIMERQVLEATQAKMDWKRVVASTKLPPPLKDEDLLAPTTTMEPWKIALAATLSVGWIVESVTQNMILTAVLSAIVWITAMADPLDEEEDNVTGPLSRVWGRFLLQAIETLVQQISALIETLSRINKKKNSSSNNKSIINNNNNINNNNVVVDDDDGDTLLLRLQQLEDEVTQLQVWKKRRLAADDALSRYSLEELKAIARQHRVVVGTKSKAQLLWHLVDQGFLELP